MGHYVYWKVLGSSLDNIFWLYECNRSIKSLAKLGSVCCVRSKYFPVQPDGNTWLGSKVYFLDTNNCFFNECKNIRVKRFFNEFKDIRAKSFFNEFKNIRAKYDLKPKWSSHVLNKLVTGLIITMKNCQIWLECDWNINVIVQCTSFLSKWTVHAISHT